MRKLALLALCCLTFGAYGQRLASPQPTVRYQFGDNLRWADPAFDDSSWPVAQNGLVPSRSRDTNRFLWVRMRVPVPNNLNGPTSPSSRRSWRAANDVAGLRQRTTDRRPGGFPTPRRSRRSSRFSGDESAFFDSLRQDPRLWLLCASGTPPPSLNPAFRATQPPSSIKLVC